MSKHTPGPWEWVDEGGWYVLMAANGIHVADDGSACGEYNREIDPEDEGESGANARLIAAAPTMLSELESILEWAIEEKAPLRAQEIASIRKVIAKATGAAE